METLQQWWQWIVERWQVEDVILEGSEHTWLILVVTVVVFIAVWSDRVWDKTKFSATLIHEIGHSMNAFFTGRRLHGLKVHSDSSGVAVSSGKQRGIGMLFTVIAGYPAPSILALVLAYLLSIGYAGMALTFYHTLLLIGLFLVRNAFGLLTVLSTIIATLGITIWNNPYAVSLTVIVLIIVYGVGGIRGTMALAQVHGARWNKGLSKQQKKSEIENSKTSDASQAARLTMMVIPAWAWIAGFMIFNIAALGASMWLLLA